MTGLTVLAGPPCAGKSTRAATMGLPVLDWDELYAEMSGLPLYARRPDAALDADVEQAFQQALAEPGDLVAIRYAPERWHRGMLRRRFGARVIVLEVPVDECLRRLEASARPPEARQRAAASIHEWWRRYEPSPNDIVNRP